MIDRNTMRFVLQTPLLQQLAGMKIAAHLWTQRDISVQIARDFYGFHVFTHFQKETSKEWKAIAEKVKSKVRALPLPQQCIEPLLILIKPLGIEILEWSLYHCIDKNSYYFLENLLPQQLCWTMHGTIDYAQTAEVTIKEERLDVERRYILARLHCFEEEARELFEAMGEERRQESAKKMLSYFGGVPDHHLAPDSTHSPGDSLHRSYFRRALMKGDGAMSEYWFVKLSQEEKERVLEDRQMQIDSLKMSRASSLLYYLSLMNEEQREHMFRECTREILSGLLRWPMQSLFTEAVQCGWSYMNEKIYSAVLNAIADQIANGFQDSQLFWEFWRLGSAEYQRHSLSNSLDYLVATKEEEIIKLVFKEAPLHNLENYFERRPIFDVIMYVLVDENVMSDAALLEWKQTAALNSENEEQRVRGEEIGGLVDCVMEKRRTERRAQANYEKFKSSSKSC